MNMSAVSVLLFAAGVLLVALALFDALRTTVSVGGGGPLTARLADGVWQGALYWHRRRERSGHPKGGHRLLSNIGPIVLLGIVATWIFLLWSGFLLVFSADAQSVLNAKTDVPADLWERLYFTGFTISTLGVGDFVPNGVISRVVVALASLSGLFLMTLSITYLIPVVSAVVEKRQLAASVTGLGETPEEILRAGWDGESLRSLEQPLVNLAERIELHAQRHLAYPVLHFFHSAEPRTAVALRVAALSEALRLMRQMPREAQPPPASVRSVRSAIDGFLGTLQSAFVRRSEQEEAPERPATEALREVGLPVREGRYSDTDEEKTRRRRRLLHALVEDAGWCWKDVTG